MSPEEIDAAASLLKALSSLAHDISRRPDDNALRDRLAILDVWLDSTAGQLEIAKRFLQHMPQGPLEAFTSMKESLDIRLTQLREAEKGGKS
jgi:hypothetical protein